MTWTVCMILVFFVAYGTAENDIALRQQFFRHLRDPKYLESKDKNECFSENPVAPPICMNFKREVEEGINDQINLELYASYVYMAMATFFRRVDVALLNIADFFQSASDEERGHAFMFIEYQNKRGGTVEFYPIKTPHKVKWVDALDAMKDTLDLEKRVYMSLLTLHTMSARTKGAQMLDFLEGEFLTEQINTIKQVGDFIQQLTRLHMKDPGVGEFIFDREMKGIKLHC